MTPIALLIVAAVAQAPQATEWKPVKPADNSFSAEMPGAAKLTTKEIPGEQGSFHQDLYACQLDGATFTIQAIRYSEPIPEESREATLDREGREFVAARGGQVVRGGQVAVDGRPGWDLTVKGPAPEGRAGVVVSRCRAVLSGQTLYYVTVVSPVDRPLPDAATRFFRSFRFDAKPAVAVADETPERALRTFLLAMATRDESTLEAVVLPADGFERLLGGTPLKPAQLAASRRQVASQSIKALKAGDEFALPDGKKQVVPPEDVADDRAVLLPEGAPLPTRLRKVEGHWKVDALPIIEARKAADSARGKSKAKKGNR